MTTATDNGYSTYSQRFRGVEWYDEASKNDIIIGGIGGIGSHLCFLMSRMSPNYMYLFDGDTVEAANLSGQLYSVSDIGELKTNAIANTVKNYSGYYPIVCFNMYTDSSFASNIMMCGFDNMTARKIFFNNWRTYTDSLSEEEKKNCLFVDGRLNCEKFQIFSITGNDDYHKDIYAKEYLFSDYEAESGSCSEKQTTYTASMIASLMANVYVNFCSLKTGAVRTLPFFIEYDAKIMGLKTTDLTVQL